MGPVCLADFESAAIPASAWTHRAHLEVAVMSVRVYGEEPALERLRNGIGRLNAAHGGKPTAYRETTTRAWVRVIALFLERHPQKTDDDVLAALSRVGKDFLHRFYSPARLASEEARLSWLEPDIQPVTWLE